MEPLYNKKRMTLGVFVSEFRDDKFLERLTGQNVGIFLVANGVYQAVIKGSKRFEGEYFCLIEDLKTRGFKEEDILPDVKPINYGELVDCLASYEKLIWL